MKERPVDVEITFFVILPGKKNIIIDNKIPVTGIAPINGDELLFLHSTDDIIKLWF